MLLWATVDTGLLAMEDQRDAAVLRMASLTTRLVHKDAQLAQDSP